MDEGFPAGRPALATPRLIVTTIHHTRHWPLSQWRARSAVDPPRSIPNRVVKRGSAEGTGGWTAGRLGPCAIASAAWSSGSSSGS